MVTSGAPSVCAGTVTAVAPVRAADDWSFIAGTYAVDEEDCKAAADHKPFSDELVEAQSEDVLTREGITSPREVHCKFKGAEKSGAGWTIKSDCEEMGEGESADLKVIVGADGSLSNTRRPPYAASNASRAGCAGWPRAASNASVVDASACGPLRVALRAARSLSTSGGRSRSSTRRA